MATAYFKNQKYSSLKKDCLKKGTLFIDPEFPANNKSLFYSKVDPDIVWKRPGELCKVPKLIVEGVTCDDLNEGQLGNTWFVSACTALAKEQKLFQKVIPDVPKVQEWGDKNEYAGIFKFTFWRYGKWLEVVIDDQLPTKNDKLVFCHSNSRNEFWSALLEKAYAKLYGDYESLCQGYTADALVDFTGGVPEKLVLSELGLNNMDKKMQFFEDLVAAMDNRALINCAIACGKDEVGQSATQGLVKGHGYILTDVQDTKVAKGLQASVGREKLQLVRLRNPWGTKEWTGAWSDESPEWNSLSVKDREKMGIKFEHEGEFWMSLDDFIKHFTNVDICHFVNTSFFSLKKSWAEALLHGEWTTGATGSKMDRAGGSDSNNPNSYLSNPQYVFELTGETDTLMMSLEQDDAGAWKNVGEEHKTIGLIIMKCESNRQFRLQIPGEKVSVSEYKKSRSIFHKVSLPRGRYVLIPTTFEAGQTGEFLLRLYTGSQAAAKPLLKDHPTSGICSKPYIIVSRLNIKKAVGLEKLQNVKTMDGYVIVRCEGESVQCTPVKNTDSPQWDFKVIFYRKQPSVKPITIEVYNYNMIKDDLCGIATIEAEQNGSEEPKVLELDLWGKGKEAKGKEKELQKPGKLFVEIKSSDDLTCF